MVKLVDEVVDEKCRKIFESDKVRLDFNEWRHIQPFTKNLMREAYLAGFADCAKKDLKTMLKEGPCPHCGETMLKKNGKRSLAVPKRRKPRIQATPAILQDRGLLPKCSKKCQETGCGCKTCKM